MWGIKLARKPGEIVLEDNVSCTETRRESVSRLWDSLDEKFR